MYTPLEKHLRAFVDGSDRSLRWVSRAESLIDTVEPLTEVLESLQDALAFYRPGGGPHLIDEAEMLVAVRRVLAELEGASSLGN